MTFVRNRDRHMTQRSKLRVYKCPYCDFWHLTSQPNQAKRYRHRHQQQHSES
jgi:hypothetical protein